MNLFAIIGIILVILPWIPLAAFMMAKAANRKKLLRIIFFTALGFCIIMSGLFREMAKMAVAIDGFNTMTTADRAVAEFFKRFYLPQLYFVFVAIVFLVINIRAKKVSHPTCP
jgi:hypothetical protein